MKQPALKAVALAAAVSVGALALATPAEAGRRHHKHWHGGGAALAGLAFGAILGGALARRDYYYDYDPYYYRPAYHPRAYYYQPPAYGYVPDYGPQPWTPEWYAYCRSKYQSFDPRSGTFQPFNGPRQLCR